METKASQQSDRFLPEAFPKSSSAFIHYLGPEFADKNNLIQTFQKLKPKSDDLVFIFLDIPCYQDPNFQRRFFAFQNEKQFDPFTSIWLEDFLQLASSLQANNIFLCLSNQSPPIKMDLEDYQALARIHQEKNFLFLEGYRKSPARFIRKLFQEEEIYGLSVDNNQDGLITCQEVANHLSLLLPASGAPTAYQLGELHHPLFFSTKKEAYIQIITPKFLTREKRFRVAGFIRSQDAIKQVLWQKQKISFGQMSRKQQKKYRLPYWPETYWFSIPQVASNQIKLQLTFGQNSRNYSLEIPQLTKGWFDEWMPIGMKKGENHGEYIWKKDNSLMSYIPEGAFISGIQQEKIKAWQQEMERSIRILEKNLQALEQSYFDKQKIVHGLEEKKNAIQNLSQRVLHVYQQVQEYTEVQQVVQSKKIIPESEDIFFLEEEFEVDLVLQKSYQDLRDFRLHHREVEIQISTMRTHFKILREKIFQVWQKQTVTLPGYYIDRYEVSNKKYQVFCEDQGFFYPPSPWWKKDYFFQRPKSPVVNVTWYDATLYSRWAGKRLISNLEYEKAARSTHQHLYPWGNESPHKGLVQATVIPDLSAKKLELSTPKEPQKVHSKLSSSPYECFHLAGNVAEWCRDQGRLEPIFSKRWGSVRGGSILDSQEVFLQAWVYINYPKHLRRSDLGFRCIVSGINN